ncbi:uncharacterized protein LOC128216210 [Mya arenaria]|uniref:uncharacterized protein LOC128216210 n=1 Tax=Mya arenaria TaxID=6604 RepID=UPI0022E092A0|nr:uncharacterized protein LOC128216210 [Mya arenaria]
MAAGGSYFYKGSDLIHDYGCSKCEENDLNTEAQHFCPDCEHYLCDKCDGIHGEYFKKHVVYGRGEIQKWAGFSIDKCDQHGKELEDHCDDHQELCCSVCVALNHRLCSSISHLPDLAKGFLQTTEFKQLPAAVDKIKSRLYKLTNSRMNYQASLRDSYENIIVIIKALRDEINQILDTLEERTVEQLDSIMKDLEKSIKDDLEICSYMDDQLSIMIEKLQHMAYKKETSSFIGFMKCQSKLSEARYFVEEIRGKEGVKYKSDESVLQLLRKLSRLGNVERVPSIYVGTAQSSSHFNVRIEKDKKQCYIAGICELPSGEMVLTDYTNDRVKLLNRQFEVIAHCDLLATPEHLCHTTDNNVAVAVSDKNEVHFLAVTKGKLQAMRKFTIHHYCCSIAHHNGQLYVGSIDGLYMYNMVGRLIKKIYQDFSGGKAVYSCAISACGERIFVTNSDYSELGTLDKTGQVISTIKDPELEYPIALCVSQSGHVFVCGLGFRTVMQVDKEGRHKLATVAREADGLYNPRSVWFSEQTSTLIVGNLLQDNLTVVKLN